MAPGAVAAAGLKRRLQRARREDEEYPTPARHGWGKVNTTILWEIKGSVRTTNTLSLAIAIAISISIPFLSIYLVRPINEVKSFYKHLTFVS